MKKYCLIASLLAALTIWSGSAAAMEVAPRISDREIVERLTRLEEGQKAIVREMAEGRKSILREMAEGRKSILREMDKRFDAVNGSISQMFHLTMGGFAILFGGIFGLIGFIIRDRRGAKKETEAIGETIKK